METRAQEIHLALGFPSRDYFVGSAFAAKMTGFYIFDAEIRGKIFALPERLQKK